MSSRRRSSSRDRNRSGNNRGSNSSQSRNSDSSSQDMWSLGSTNSSSDNQAKIPWKTEFHKLPPKMQNNIVLTEKMIKDDVVKKSEDIARLLASGKTNPIHSVKKELKAAQDEAASLAGILEDDKHAVEELKRDIRIQTQHAEGGSRSLEYLGAHAGHYSGLMFSGFPSPYFIDLLASFDERMAQYNKQIAQIDEYLGTSHCDAVDDPQKLKEIVHSQYEYFMGNATQAAALHEEIIQLKQQFLLLLKQMNIKEDPFKSAKLHKQKKSALQEKIELPPPIKVIKRVTQEQKKNDDSWGSDSGWGGDTGWGDSGSKDSSNSSSGNGDGGSGGSDGWGTDTSSTFGGW